MMKKRRFFTLALLGAALILFSSCSKDEETPPLGPSLTITESLSGSTGGSVEITQGAPLVFAWESRKGDTDLQTFSISQTGANVESPVPMTYQGNDIPYEVSGDDKSIYVDTLAFANAGTNLGTTNYSFKITDTGGLTTTVTYNVTVVQAEDNTELSEELPFTWTRVGGDPAEGLTQFGLKWTENSSTSAIVAIDGNTTMVDLGSTAWTSIVTHGDLDDAIAAGTPIATYTGVSATEDGTYNDVLGVINGDASYIIHITNGTVTTGSAGTTIVIAGMYKN